MLQLEVIGNLGSDAEIKEFNGKKYVSMNVAHSEKKERTAVKTPCGCPYFGMVMVVACSNTLNEVARCSCVVALSQKHTRINRINRNVR